jgi:hypothetical protein
MMHRQSIRWMALARTMRRGGSFPILRAVLIVSVLAASILFAQPPRGPGRGGRGSDGYGRRLPDRGDYPMWENPVRFSGDVFTFARIEYDTYYGPGYGRMGGWRNDYPDCDWNFSFRLQQMTALKTDPNGRVLRLTDPDLPDYPFVYMSNPGSMSLSEYEVLALRSYLLNGGFLMADDFWARAEWSHIRSELARVFPDRVPRELALDHEIFHIVYDLKRLPQVPSIRAWRAGYPVEVWHGEFEGGDERPHFYGLFDDKGRLMALLCHNNDIGDGWEREGEEREYFELYSEKFSYPIGINIVTYAMTH